MSLSFIHHSRRGAFSLVEVAISLGIVSFALVGVLGALPLAMSSGRSSIAQTRATALAGCLYSSFRSQAFGKVCYVDAQFGADGVTAKAEPSPDAINLFKETTASGGSTAASAVFYASIVDVPSQALSNDPRRVKYTADRQQNSTYRIEMRCNSQPDGLIMTGLANRVEIAISPVDRPQDIYKFSSVITNRSGSGLGVTSS